MGRPSDAIASFEREEMGSDLSKGIGFALGGRFFPAWRFVEEFLMVQRPDGRSARFAINGDQARLYVMMERMKLEGKPVRLDVLKARQMGFSTFVAALVYVLCFFQPGKGALVVAHDASTASLLLDKYRFFHESIRSPALRLPLRASNRKELVAVHPGGALSRISIAVPDEGSARGSTNNYLHLSEVAFWDCDLMSAWPALLSTVPRNDPGSICVVETTANGFNPYKEFWDRDSAGETAFRAAFFPWWEHSEYRGSRELRDSELNSFEKGVREKVLRDFGKRLDGWQMAFYRERLSELGLDRGKLGQEYPSWPAQAFVASGTGVFDPVLLAERRQALRGTRPLRRGRFSYREEWSPDGRSAAVEKESFEEWDDGPLKVYSLPEKGHWYVISIDPAMGGEDRYAMQLVDACTGRQAASYAERGADDRDVAFQALLLAREYGNCLITAETNVSTGDFILRAIQATGYPWVWNEGTTASGAPRQPDRLGFRTTPGNRDAMIASLKERFARDPASVSDLETISEMESFVVGRTPSGKEKAQAARGAHDDLVTSLCGAYYCMERSGWPTVPEDPAAALPRGDVPKFVDWREEPWR